MSISPPLAARLGQAVVVENRPGAGGAIAAEIAAKAALLPVASVRELIAALKAKPRQPFGSGGTASGMHLAGEFFRSLAGVDLYHVPYKGNGPAMSDLSGGQIPIVFVDLGSTAAYAKSTRVKVLAVAARERTPMAPDIPTASESGLPGWEALGSFGLVTAVGTPRPTIVRLHKEVTEILKLPDIRTRILATNNEPAPTSPEEYDAFIKSEVAKWMKVIKEADIKFD